MSPEPLAADESFSLILSGTPEMVRPILRLIAMELRDAGGYRLQESNHGEMGPGLSLRLEHGSIGWIFLLALPGERTLLRVPAGRESPGTRWEHDPDGSRFAAFLQQAMDELRSYGFISSRSRFKSADILESALRQLGAADTPAAYAAVANMCRTALVALGRELFSSEMVGRGSTEPKADDSAARLKSVAAYHWGSRSPRQLEGIKKSIEGRWGIASASLHRQSATREEAELCIVESTALFDSLALLVPKT